jgi:hypothetical protein
MSREREERVPTVVRVQILGFLSLFEVCGIARVSKAWRVAVEQRQRQVKELNCWLDGYPELGPSRWHHMLAQPRIAHRLQSQLKSLKVRGADCEESWACVRLLLIGATWLTALDLSGSSWFRLTDLNFMCLSMSPLRTVQMPMFNAVPASFRQLLMNSPMVQTTLQELECPNATVAGSTHSILDGIHKCTALVRVTIYWTQQSVPLEPWLLFLRDHAPPTLQTFTFRGVTRGSLTDSNLCLLATIRKRIAVRCY